MTQIATLALFVGVLLLCILLARVLSAQGGNWFTTKRPPVNISDWRSTLTEREERARQIAIYYPQTKKGSRSGFMRNF